MDSAVDRGCSMVRAVVCFSLLALLMCLGAAAVAADDAKTPDGARPDPRLDQRITISTAYDSLQEFCAKLGALTGATAQSAGADAGEANGRPPVRQAQGKQKAAPTGEANPSPPVPVDITCDPAIKEHKVVVRVKEQPLREVMRQIAVLFDFTWMQGPQEHPRYHLMQNSARGKRAEEMRQRYLKERSARYRQIFKDTVRAAGAGPDELRDLAQTDPTAVALAVTTPCIGVLRALDDAAVDAVLAGELVKLPFSSLSADAQAAVKERFLRRRPTEADWLWDQADLTFQRDEGSFQWHVSVRLDLPAATPDTRPVQDYPVAFLEPQGLWPRLAYGLARYEDREGGENSEPYQRLRSLETDYGVSIIDRAQKQGADAVPPWARPGARSEAPKPNGEVVALKGSYASFYSWFPLLLRDVAEQLDINLVADCYWTHCDRGRDSPSRDSESRYAPVYPSIKDEKGTYYVDSNPECALYRICEQRGRGWVKDGEFYRVRNLLWFVDDPEEVTASVLKEWLRRTDDEKHAAPEDYVYLVTNLSQRLAENIRATQYCDSSSEPRPLYRATAVSDSAGGYYAMKLYSMLAPDLRKRAQDAGIDVNTELPEDPLRMVEKLLTEDRSYNNEPLINRLTPEQLSNLRLWIGRRVVEMPIDETGGREGVRDHRFCVELWGDGQPTWTDQGGKGRVFGASYWLRQTQDPDKVGKLAEPYATIERERQRKAK